jgi:hypothetical protein
VDESEMLAAKQKIAEIEDRLENQPNYCQVGERKN